MGCVRETAQIKDEGSNWMCEGDSPKKNNASIGCMRETAQVKIKPAWDV